MCAHRGMRRNEAMLGVLPRMGHGNSTRGRGVAPKGWKAVPHPCPGRCVSINKLSLLSIKQAHLPDVAVSLFFFFKEN